MKAIIILLVSCMMANNYATSQGLTNYGAYISSDANTSIVLTGNSDLVFENNSGSAGEIILNGNTTIDGKILNNSVSPTVASSGAGTISFNGSTPQEIGGSNSLQLGKIDLQNTVYLSNNLDLTSNLNFTSGVFKVMNYDLKLIDAANISGNTSTNFVNTENSGNLIMYAQNGGSAILFPIGTSTSYTPATISLISGASQYFSARLLDGVYSNGLTGDNLALVEPLVNRTWIIYTDLSHNVNLSLQWNLIDEVNGFDRTSAFSNVYDNQWNTGGAIVTGSNPYVVTFDGVTSLTTKGVYAMDDNTKPLSVELIIFEGIANQRCNHIKWSTASEQNSEYFVLLSSTDNIKFDKVFVQIAAGNSNTLNNYEYDDITNRAGSIYYKLEEHDINGNVHSSNTIVISRQKSDISFWQYNKKLMVDLKNCPRGDINLCFYDLNGRLLAKNNFSQTDKNSLLIIDISSFPMGVYFANIYGNDNILYSDKIVLDK